MNKTQIDLIVMRDGQLDQDYLRQKHIEALQTTVQTIGHNVLHMAGRATLAIGKELGWQVLLSYAGAYDMLWGTDTIGETRAMKNGETLE